ncbi:tetratricopeptide repeat protein [Varunaivibrio sulfuroxidans]|uniref:Uncharacterized protein n=1 Tax=Varunaivibrio sulfuroxidans TaxID=1773489 RepID=A0A4R3J5Q3_9PROT|nr:tetratricopeptide repeat protein [Varunaivibrio sulfuroxidans]TCS60657.1 hypothetical protein EDD55_110133 [Varunaivibrio sulfuroxidans]WES30148.1 hypothetical protein P3M64_10930 [Varunaivibrio sulfuroxidans]
MLSFHRTYFPRAALIFSFFLIAPSGVRQARAAEIDGAKAYRHCMDLAISAPRKGFDVALSWEGVGGGDAARHCAAAAMMGLGMYDEAAKRFTDLAQNIKASADFKARLLGHAAQADMLANKPAQAQAVLDAALKLSPNDTGLRVDRGVARAALGAYWDAIDDFSIALKRNSRLPEAYIFRATAYRYLGSLGLARDDIVRALALDPKNPEGLLESGILKRLSGDLEGARRAWVAVVLAAPGSPAARSAQQNIERMDVHIKAPANKP